MPANKALPNDNTGQSQRASVSPTPGAPPGSVPGMGSPSPAVMEGPEKAVSGEAEVSAFLFQRALRLDDNKGLLAALERSQTVIPVFCVDPRQCSLTANRYASPFCIGFMLESLQDLQRQLQAVGSDLLLLCGLPHEVLPPLLDSLKVTHLYAIEDYTPFSRERAEALKKAWTATKSSAANTATRKFIECDDYLLHNPSEVVRLEKKGKPFKVYTPFAEAVWSLPIAAPRFLTSALSKRLARGPAFASLVSQHADNAWAVLKANSRESPVPGGRAAALQRLHGLPQRQATYAAYRDLLPYKTSMLSPYLKFGCISCREAWEATGTVQNEESVRQLRRELLWREFFYHYFIHYPEDLEWNAKPQPPPASEPGAGTVRAKSAGADQKRTTLPAEYTESVIDPNAHPIIKACYNQLNETGFINNRGRLILANYVLKHKGDYWKQGDLLFAKRLVDYDPLLNIGNWRWVDKQPLFRQLKPEVQMKWDRAPDGSEKGGYTKFWSREASDKF